MAVHKGQVQAQQAGNREQLDPVRYELGAQA